MLDVLSETGMVQCHGFLEMGDKYKPCGKKTSAKVSARNSVPRGSESAKAHVSTDQISSFMM